MKRTLGSVVDSSNIPQQWVLTERQLCTDART